MTTTTNTTNPIKTITKIVTFYSDGTFTEYTPSPGMMPPVNPYPIVNPPWHQHPPYPWWQNPVVYCGGYGSKSGVNFGPGGGGGAASYTEGGGAAAPETYGGRGADLNGDWTGGKT